MSFEPSHQHRQQDIESFDIVRITPTHLVVDTKVAQAGCRSDIGGAYRAAIARARELSAPNIGGITPDWYIVTPTWLDSCRYADRYKEEIAMRQGY